MIGELSALGGSCCWATCSTLFAFSVRKLGIYSLNLIRLSTALILLSLTLWCVTGSPVPLNASLDDWLWLALSSLIGLVIGDLLYFGALKSIGPRITMVLFTVSPPVAALGEWVLFNRGLGFLALLGMAIALLGVTIVVTNKNEKNSDSAFTINFKGVVLGLSGAACQGIGLVFSKMGLSEIDALGGTFIRMAFAAPLFAVVFFIMGGKITKILKERKGLIFGLFGAFFGPFLGVTLSLVAVKHTHSGIAMTLLSTTPITILPFSILIYKEKLSLRAVGGAFIAVVGISLLFL